jgi:putative glycosyltransferase (TIGR04372 family)
MIPLKHRPRGKNDLFIHKIYRCSESQRILSFREVLDRGALDFKRTHQYKANGLEVVDNTAEEILALAKELNERIDKTWQSQKEDLVLQERFDQIFPAEFKLDARQSLVGSDFLRQNQNLLD